MVIIVKLYFFIFIFLFSFALLANPKSFSDFCSKEISTNCPDVKKTKSRQAQCLLEKGKNISEPCEKALHHLMSSTKQKSEGVCKPDVKEHCRWVIPGGGRILKCLFANESKLSEPCRVALNEP
ncbi:hypothetical protein P3G55_00845 [Leptospira sp. 96542]|nr:hypothetical protein [Leptospira sp. 96542]